MAVPGFHHRLRECRREVAAQIESILSSHFRSDTSFPFKNPGNISPLIGQAAGFVCQPECHCRTFCDRGAGRWRLSGLGVLFPRHYVALLQAGPFLSHAWPE